MPAGQCLCHSTGGQRTQAGKIPGGQSCDFAAAASAISGIGRAGDGHLSTVPAHFAGLRPGRYRFGACSNCLPLLKELREHFGSRVDIVTVETGNVLSDEASCFECGGWKEQLRDLYPEIHYIRKSKVEDGILKYLGHNEADLVMVFPKKHGFFDFHISQSRRLAQSSPVPVLSLHA